MVILFVTWAKFVTLLYSVILIQYMLTWVTLDISGSLKWNKSNAMYIYP